MFIKSSWYKPCAFSSIQQQSFWKEQTVFPDVFCHILKTDLNCTFSRQNLSFHLAWDRWSGLCEQPWPLATPLALLWTGVDCFQRLSRALSWEQHCRARVASPADWESSRWSPAATSLPPSHFKDQSRAGAHFLAGAEQVKARDLSGRAACNSNKGLIFLV